jgi:hypothetical protein
VNDGDEEVVWVITRSGSEAVVEHLEGWGKGRDVRNREREWKRKKRVLRKEENLGVYWQERKVAFAICIAEQRQSLGGWC